MMEPVSTPTRVPAWVWFVAWAGAGLSLMLAVLGAMTIGMFVLPIAAGFTVFVATRKGSIVGIGGLVSGGAFPLWFVAFLNRDGPGAICRNFATGSSCTEEMNPWPWLGIGLGFFVAGVVVFVTMARAAGRAGPVSEVRER